MKVEVLSHTENIDQLIATAAKLCYSKSNIDDLMDSLTPDKVESFIKMLKSLGHESPFEHASITFGIEGVSRITEQQLTRHRIASYSIQSGRYVNRENPEYSIPDSIKNDQHLLDLFNQCSSLCSATYRMLITNLTDTYKNKGMSENVANKKAIEDARYILPNSLQTKIIVTMNLRSLFNFFNERCCNRAQWEIRSLANEMLKKCKEISPLIFEHAGAKCKNGYCPENKMQCEQFKGKIPTLKELTYNKINK